jgi:hypothetical protein
MKTKKEDKIVKKSDIQIFRTLRKTLPRQKLLPACYGAIYPLFDKRLVAGRMEYGIVLIPIS